MDLGGAGLHGGSAEGGGRPAGSAAWTYPGRRAVRGRPLAAGCPVERKHRWAKARATTLPTSEGAIPAGKGLA